MTSALRTAGNRLRAKYGEPTRFDSNEALRLLGLNDVDPQAVIAYQYPTQEAADDFADANRADGTPVHRVPVEGAFVNLIDLRPKLQAGRSR